MCQFLTSVFYRNILPAWWFAIMHTVSIPESSTFHHSGINPLCQRLVLHCLRRLVVRVFSIWWRTLGFLSFPSQQQSILWPGALVLGGPHVFACLWACHCFSLLFVPISYKPLSPALWGCDKQSCKMAFREYFWVVLSHLNVRLVPVWWELCDSLNPTEYMGTSLFYSQMYFIFILCITAQLLTMDG